MDADGGVELRLGQPGLHRDRRRLKDFRRVRPTIFISVALCAALLFTYPHLMLSVLAILYLAMIPLSYRRFQWHLAQDRQGARDGQLLTSPPAAPPVQTPFPPSEGSGGGSETRH